MKLSEIKQIYNTYPYEGGYMLFDPTKEGYNLNHKYCGCIKFKNGKACVDGFEYTASIDALKEQLTSYETSLPYRIDYYVPIYKESALVEFVIHEHLRDIGFKSDFMGSGYGIEVYTLNHDKNAYEYKASNFEIGITGLKDKYNSNTGKYKTPENCTIMLSTGRYRWVETTCKRDAEAIKTAIDSLIKPVLVSEGVNLIKASDKMTNIAPIDITLAEFNPNSLSGKSVEYKQALKTRLLELAESL